MEHGNVLTETDGGLLVVTLHWPERRNALSHGMRVDLLDCVRRAETDAAVRAIVITGHGDKSFSAGAHIPELEERTPVSEMGPAATLRKDLPTAIERLGKPTVAAINGYCLGAGLELAMGCTVRIASENALLGQPEIALGQIPGSGGTQRLYRFVGLGWAMQMVLTGQRIDARTAASIGLVTEVVPQADLLPRAKELARDMGSRAPMAFVAGRDAVLRSTETDLLTGIDYERKLYALCIGTEDAREGMRAYAEKRAPEYRGR
ncbi:MAG: enoyl-CoA hydratase-related protein [Defluviicoccus sp.]|nr:enoyl-CoA hydratase-related protein [Defluviicoccus sp.]MDE0278768.1 enoyl-CoA hydratase-related protein [Defluviicoccus sp.]